MQAFLVHFTSFRIYVKMLFPIKSNFLSSQSVVLKNIGNYK